MIELFGTAAAAAMVFCYALEHRAPAYALGFAASCAAAAGYALAIGSWSFFAIESVWAVVAARRALRRLESLRGPTAPDKKGTAMDAIRNDRERVAEPMLDPAEVCTLSSEGLAERLAWIREELLPHARRVERLESGLAWKLDMAPGLAEKLDHLIALERECCGGIVFERTEGSVPGRLRLEVRGIDPDAPTVQAPRIPRGDDPAGWTRLAKAGAFGVSMSLLVCCILPLLAAALVGSAAASLAALDQPWVIGVGTFAATAVAWR